MSEHCLGAAENLLKDGEMKRFELDGKAVVVARVDGDYHAFGGTCSHYGAPLEKGVLKGHAIMCPWHHACFDVRDGQRLEPPALNDIAHYPVSIDADRQVCVTLPHTNEREPQGKAGDDARVFVIVGGGSAGNAAAEELRRAGFGGQIVMLSSVSTVPVDRPNLSKDYLAGKAEPDWIPLRDEAWYEKRDIELRLKTRVTGIDAQKHTVTLDGGEALRYDRLLLATGGIPRQLRIEGAGLDGVFTLRTLADADHIIEAAEAHKQGVIIGSSFIGLEVAASLAKGRKADVTIVAPEAVPFEKVLGKEIGQAFKDEHEANGVHFRLESEVARFVSEDGRVSGVELKSGETLPAEFVIVGIGVTPATDFLKDSGLDLDAKDQSVKVSAQLQTSQPDIFAAGDIARWDDGSERGQRIEHWRVAEQHGIVAAQAMLGQTATVENRVPFFWTNQWGFALRYVGHATAWDEVIFRDGKTEDKSFIAFYVRDGQMAAACGCKHDPEMVALELIMRDGLPLSVAQMRDEQFDLIAHARGK